MSIWIYLRDFLGLLGLLAVLYGWTLLGYALGLG